MKANNDSLSSRLQHLTIWQIGGETCVRFHPQLTTEAATAKRVCFWQFACSYLMTADGWISEWRVFACRLKLFCRVSFNFHIHLLDFDKVSPFGREADQGPS